MQNGDTQALPKPYPPSLPATAATRAEHERALHELPPDDPDEEADARRGFIGTVPDAEVRGAYGQLVWSLADYAFLNEPEAPDTAHPSLWRHARINSLHGLFKVTERIYQVRGFDVSNVTFIEGDSGLIVIDPLTCKETAEAALALYCAHRPKRPVVAVIYSHSHADHFGGVRGVTNDADVQAGRTAIIAPAGFMEEAVSENVMAGPAMARRAQFQFGHTLARNACCQIDAGMGKTMPRGTITLIPPTQLIREPLETHVIDGVEIVFQLTPESEAPAEMHFYFPQERALNLAENGTRSLHNLCPLRGANVRNAQRWARYLGESLERFGRHADVVFAQHNWPTWGRERIAGYLEAQRDLYKYLHDQTVRMMNRGMNAAEIAEVMRLPDSLHALWHARGYYGTVSHNVKAIYQQYLSWYDGNPSNLHALPPELAAPRYVEYMGGADAVLERARRDFGKGEYRWVAQVMNHLVFAQPQLLEARALGAAALEQMGYQAESATWRNAFLLGARELREGHRAATQFASRSRDMVCAITEDMFFDYLAVRIDGLKAQNLTARFDWRFSDVDKRFSVNLQHGALTWSALPCALPPHAQIDMTRETLNLILCGETGFAGALREGQIRVTGDLDAFKSLLGALEQVDNDFNVVEP
ncbi:alkyl sulfatase dimerization domain-containing protein [Caballeronia sp. LZ008]|uniref:alkyl/aryl-sulfatase n=1 Tax=unclassified Caballeronia TaxID=2646786 RepID=UPI002027A2E9|nr:MULTISPECIES: alkyl sulfatase dimerization domain-containing protein [unclassified Caballeronia]MDR5792873.1 alkyl sulfatase dimerization domain-containing protein [Caballeronia sp. LZ008]